ncbi:MAG TPA: MmcB family DNA repair protein [Thermoguttaceae bacterium]|nr:MmcB family DNA repair protein [Thermoguttaceae bacterium]
MKRSWTNPLVTAYEIKSSRTDFVQDNKWHLYLPYCNEFYFVAPPKIIDPQELPAEAGLLVASTNLARLFCRKKAQRRQVDIPEDLWRYVLICRAKVTRDTYSREATREEWQKWLEQRNLDHDLGRRVSRSLQKTIAERIHKVESQNLALQEQIKNAEEVRQFLSRIGLTPSWCPTYEIERRVKSRIPRNLRPTIKTLDRELLKLVTILDGLENASSQTNRRRRNRQDG